jgi:D-tyrosyl-tRNA(Tyr) deacylase
VRAVITRVSWAKVRVGGEIVGEIGAGICALIGVGGGDTEKDALWLADKMTSCRFFQDDAGKMNRSLLEVRGELLGVSQFTLYGDLRRGNRPSFSAAMEPLGAESLFNQVCSRVRDTGTRVQTGRFGARMEVESLNLGPVTLLLDSSKLF